MPFLPPWSGMHPMLVHFPVALLVIVPVFYALALYRREPTGPYAVSAWVILAMGTAAAWLSTESGEAAASIVVATPQIQEALHRHAEWGETARSIATALWVVQSALWAWVALLKRPLGKGWGMGTLWLLMAGSLAGTVAVALAGHAGAYLVHGLGVTNNSSFLPPLP